MTDLPRGATAHWLCHKFFLASLVHPLLLLAFVRFNSTNWDFIQRFHGYKNVFAHTRRQRLAN